MLGFAVKIVLNIFLKEAHVLGNPAIVNLMSMLSSKLSPTLATLITIALKWAFVMVPQQR